MCTSPSTFVAPEELDSQPAVAAPPAWSAELAQELVRSRREEQADRDKARERELALQRERAKYD